MIANYLGLANEIGSIMVFCVDKKWIKVITDDSVLYESLEGGDLTNHMGALKYALRGCDEVKLIFSKYI